jgi:hypothetical protein
MIYNNYSEEFSRISAQLDYWASQPPTTEEIPEQCPPSRPLNNSDITKEIFHILYNLPLLSVENTPYYSEDYGFILRDNLGTMVFINLEFIPENNSECLTISHKIDGAYLTNLSTSTANAWVDKYIFPVGMTLNLALEVIKERLSIEFPWDDTPNGRYDEEDIFFADEHDDFFSDILFDTNQQYKKHFGQRPASQETWELQRIVGMLKLVESLLKQGKEIPQQLIDKYLNIVLGVSVQSKATPAIISSALQGLQQGRISTVEEKRIQTLAYIVSYTLSSALALENSSTIKQCPLCGRLFFPKKRTDQIYCDYIGNPNYRDMSCREAWNNIRPRLNGNINKVKNRIKNRHHRFSKADKQGGKYGKFMREYAAFEEELSGNAPKNYLDKILFLCYQEICTEYEVPMRKVKSKSGMIDEDAQYALAFSKYSEIVGWLEAPFKTKADFAAMKSLLMKWKQEKSTEAQSSIERKKQ